MRTATNPHLARSVAGAALLAAVGVLAYLLLNGGSSYTIHAHFADASGLVTGDSVELAGRGVGSVTDIGVTPDGQADVTLSIGDPGITPLHVGTRAGIRALGQAGLTNRYVALTPGPGTAPPMRSGATLPTTQTQSLVNLDAILDSFGPAQRAHLDALIAHSADIYAGSGARDFNRMLGEFDPALTELNGFTGQLADDSAAITNVIHTGATTARAIASRSPDLIAAVRNTATTMNAIAGRRAALADDLVRAPAVLQQARLTLKDAGTAITALRPALRDVPPAAEPLATFLHKLDSILPQTTPVVAQLRSELPDLQSVLAQLQPLAPVAIKALRSAGVALRVARPITRAMRYYGADLIIGVFAGLAGNAAANYNRWGHYARLEFTQPYQTSLGGPLSGLLSKPLFPGLFDLRTRLLRRCPGGNTPPAIDNSSPWIPDASICTPSDDTPLSVDFP